MSLCFLLPFSFQTREQKVLFLLSLFKLSHHSEVGYSAPCGQGSAGNAEPIMSHRIKSNERQYHTGLTRFVFIRAIR